MREFQNLVVQEDWRQIFNIIHCKSGVLELDDLIYVIVNISEVEHGIKGQVEEVF
ncbi:MAG: hypothetical protein RL226_1736 [Bacteroidota bacterium]